MGAKLFKQTFETQIGVENNESALADNEEFLSHKTLDEDFNRLYLDSRTLLHGITRNPSDDLLTTIRRYTKTNSKYLSSCFNEAASLRSDIVDPINDRLAYRGTDCKVQNREPKFIGSYLLSAIKRSY